MENENITLKEIKEHLRNNFKKGTNCPACGQCVRLYEYKMFRMSAVALIFLYRISKDNPEKSFFHISEYAEAIPGKKIRSPHFAELRFWGLVSPATKKTKEHNASGYWSITEKGIDFVEGIISVPGKVLVYNNKFRGFSGENITISEALEGSFDYLEIISPKEEKKPNILGQCPECRGGLYKMRVSGKDQIQCLNCHKIL